MSGSEQQDHRSGTNSGVAGKTWVNLAEIVAQVAAQNTFDDGWKVAVILGDGTVANQAVLSTYGQVILLAERLQPSGFYMALLGSALNASDYHFVFRPDEDDSLDVARSFAAPDAARPRA